MRSSDWSSDVCSSDLYFVVIRISKLLDRLLDMKAKYENEGNEEKKKKKKKRKSKKRQSLSSSSDGEEEDSGFSVEERKILSEQIGRAACRERGGQYV